MEKEGTFSSVENVSSSVSLAESGRLLPSVTGPGVDGLADEGSGERLGDVEDILKALLFPSADTGILIW